MKIIHSLLKEYLGDLTPTAEKVEELLNFHVFEVDGMEVVEGETVLDVDVLPNRASDALSHRGIARELATILNVNLANDPLEKKPDFTVSDKIKINITAPDICPRFTASIIKGVTVKESPEWLKAKLRAMGQRPINNIVDATNYVMFTIGQPLHAYDADLLSQQDGKYNFNIRLANTGESIPLLSEGDREEDRIVELKGTELLIVDGVNNTALGLAGIKGGRSTGVSSSTKNIIIEAAHFNPINIRKTARGLGIVTEATKRFENEPSRELPIYAQAEITKLIINIAGGESEGLVDEYLTRAEPAVTSVNIENVNRFLGTTLTVSEIQKLIERIGAKVELDADKVIKATAPWERKDLKIEADYIEEVARLHGLNNIKSVTPEVTTEVEINQQQYYGDKIRDILLSQGFSEVINSSFQKKGDIQLLNSLASDKSCLRQNLSKKITENLDANYAHIDLLGMKAVKVFEIGTVFSKQSNTVTEHFSLSLGIRTKGDGYSQKDDDALKVVLDNLNSSLGVAINWSIEKGVAETNLSTLITKLPVAQKYEPVLKTNPVTYKTISPYPAIARDIALWVKSDETADSVLIKLVEAAGNLCVRQDLFDTFTKDDRTSYAFRLVFQAKDRTLTDIEINAVMETLYGVAAKNGWQVR